MRISIEITINHGCHGCDVLYCIHPSFSFPLCNLCMMWMRRSPLLFAYIPMGLHENQNHNDMILDCSWLSYAFYDSERVQIVHLRLDLNLHDLAWQVSHRSRSGKTLAPAAGTSTTLHIAGGDIVEKKDSTPR